MNTEHFTNTLSGGLLLLTLAGVAGTADAQTAAGTYELDRTEPRTIETTEVEYDRVDRVDRSSERYESNVWGPQEGEWELTLSGAGVSDQDFDSNTVGLTVDASKYFSELLSAGVRQTLSVSDSADDRAYNGATSAFGQFHFGDGRFRPFVGVEVGYLYGDDVSDTFFGGPEAGIRYYVKDDAFLFARANYQFLFESGDEIDDRFDDGRFLYTVGIGLTF